MGSGESKYEWLARAMKDGYSGVQGTQHSLYQISTPLVFFERMLRIHPQEVKLLAWVTAIQLVMSSGSIILNNTAQTTFLTRYGVEALPVVFLVEALVTLVFTVLVGFLMERFRTIRVFTGLLLFYGIAIAVIRMLIPFDIDLIYPLLYVLKSQSVGILPILYWDILNDLFTTQQSKRLYTLISAGGILGATIGSLMTGRIALWIGLDNVLLLFTGCMAVAAVLNELTEKVTGSPMEVRTNRHKAGVGVRYKESLQQFIAYAHSSPLLKYMILLLAIPNVILPLMDYQFNVIVSDHFLTERSTLAFFGLFRGVSNASIFLILLFSSRMITRWGVPFSLLIHPINYFVAFGAIFSQFGILAGVYARFSTEMLKTVLNNPARAVLYNFFPEEMRGLIRLILRGGVVRAADFVGSGFLTLIKGAVAPQALSLVAMPLVLIWVFTAFRLRSTYSQMLLVSLQSGQTDWKRLETDQLAMMARDKPTREMFLRGLESPDPDVALLCAEFFARTGGDEWTVPLINSVENRSAEIQKKLLDLLTPEIVQQHLERIYALALAAPPDKLAIWLSLLRRFAPEQCPAFVRQFLTCANLGVETEALAGIYPGGNKEDLLLFRRRVSGLLSGSRQAFRFAIKVIGMTGDPLFHDILLKTATSTDDPELKAWSIEGLTRMKHEGIFDIVASTAKSGDLPLRKAALEGLLAAQDSVPEALLISFLQDEDQSVRDMAANAAGALGEKISVALLASLVHPSRRLRGEVIDLLGHIGLPQVATSSFILEETRKAYTYLVSAHLLSKGGRSRASELLQAHLAEKQKQTIETVLRIAGALELGDHMRVIVHALRSGRQKDMDKAIEILHDTLHADIRGALLPLLDDSPDEEKIAAGRRVLKFPDPTGAAPAEVLRPLLSTNDRVLTLLCFYVVAEDPLYHMRPDIFQKHLSTKDGLLCETAQWALERSRRVKNTEGKEILPEWISKLAYLRVNSLFKSLAIEELITIAERCPSKWYQPGEIVVNEGSPGNCVYLVCEGDLAFESDLSPNHHTVAGHLLKHFLVGDMACIDGDPQAYTVVAGTACLLFAIDCRDFHEFLFEYPTLSISLCRHYSEHLLQYHHYLSGGHTRLNAVSGKKQ